MDKPLDPMVATQDAVLIVINRLGVVQRLAPEGTKVLCSVCADFSISEVVDQPNWAVSCHLPLLVFN